jgi:NTE family protein
MASAELDESNEGLGQDATEALLDTRHSAAEQLATRQGSAELPAPKRKTPRELGQIVLVLQGGGALGAYQVGVYQALHESGIEPDWVIGPSIGAINASLIAGNAAEDRLSKLEEFWGRVEHGPLLRATAAMPVVGPMLAHWLTITGGIGAFFAPYWPAFAGFHTPLGADMAGYYSTAPLRATLNELVDFSRISKCAPRLSVGAANVRTAAMHYFDSRDMTLSVDHVMASGALPPAFPAIRIDGELFWDGGICSNTPVEAVFDDFPRRNSVVFAVHIWNPQGPDPETIWQVLSRQKDIQYSSRAVTHIARQKQIHRLRHVVAELAKRLPDAERQRPEVSDLAEYGCLTRMHVVRLLAPPMQGEDHTKDIDFSYNGIRSRWRAGYADTKRVLNREPWNDAFDPIEGFILHEALEGHMEKSG